MHRRLYALILLTLFLAGLLGCNNEPKLPSKFDAYFACTTYVEKRLKSPSSAEFGPYSESKVRMIRADAEGKYFGFVVTGYVDSQNSFGAMLRANYECHTTGRMDGKWRPDKIEIN